MSERESGRMRGSGRQCEWDRGGGGSSGSGIEGKEETVGVG